MTDAMKTAAKELISDEIELFARLVPLAAARVVELGCGKAELARRLLERRLVASVRAFEVDRVQHARNLADPHPPNLEFLSGGAEAIPLDDACCEVVLMLKSLHHVPMPMLDQALHEIRRVLVAGGHLYVSEPVFAGEFNEIVRLFHDEGVVRAAAQAALRRAAGEGVLVSLGATVFDMPLAFRDFDDFNDRVIRVTHTSHDLDAATLAEVRRRFDRHMTPDGARFVREMRVDVLRRP